MAEVYENPIEAPTFSFELTHKELKQNDDEYLSKVRNYIKSMGYDGKYAGELLMFSTTIGYALYMVIDLKRAWVTKIKLNDNLNSHEIYNMSSEDLLKKIQQQKEIEKIFGK